MTVQVDQVVRLPLGAVVVGDGRRPVRDVSSLMRSMEDIGLMNPITVREDRRLIAGLHRLEAARRLGWDSIPCYVMGISGIRAEIAEIDENICRNEPPALERNELLAKRKQLYQALHPETRSPSVRGGPGRGGKTPDKLSDDSPTFAADTAKQLGVDERTINRFVRSAEAITEETKEVIRGTPVENKQTALDVLAAEQDAEEQRRKAEAMVAGTAKPIDIQRETPPKRTSKRRAVTTERPSGEIPRDIRRRWHRSYRAINDFLVGVDVLGEMRVAFGAADIDEARSYVRLVRAWADAVEAAADQVLREARQMGRTGAA